jgi:hypothetical protein
VTLFPGASPDRVARGPALGSERIRGA